MIYTPTLPISLNLKSFITVPVLKRVNIIGFIIIFLASVCIMPATHQAISDSEDLRAAVILAKKLSNQVNTVNLSFSDTFTETINSLRRLSSFELTLAKEDTNNGSPINTIVLSPRFSYLTNTNYSYTHTFFSYDIGHRDQLTIYNSISLPPDVPPPIYS